MTSSTSMVLMLSSTMLLLTENLGRLMRVTELLPLSTTLKSKKNDLHLMKPREKGRISYLCSNFSWLAVNMTLGRLSMTNGSVLA